MQSAKTPGAATRFLGVRLSEEELSLLDRLRAERSLDSRSAAVRALVREGAPPGRAAIDLPATVLAELAELVEDGYAHDVHGLLDAIVALGLKEMVRTHTESLPAMRDHARAVRDRRASRRRADREGRGLLER